MGNGQWAMGIYLYCEEFESRTNLLEKPTPLGKTIFGFWLNSTLTKQRVVVRVLTQITRNISLSISLYLILILYFETSYSLFSLLMICVNKISESWNQTVLYFY